MEEEIELKGCPFCGAAAMMRSWPLGGVREDGTPTKYAAIVKCSVCLAEGELVESRESQEAANREAAESWNHRV